MVRIEEIQKKVQDRLETGEFALYIRDEDGVVTGFEEVESVTFDGDRFDVVLDTEIVVEKLYMQYRSKFVDRVSSQLKDPSPFKIYLAFLKSKGLTEEEIEYKRVLAVAGYKREEVEMNAFLNNHLWNRVQNVFISTSWEDIFLEFYHDERLLLLHFPARIKAIGYIMPPDFSIRQFYNDLHSQFLSETYINSLKSSFLLV
ncbi:hypothetical protein KEJ32_02485 [Candidatus Bathyarchaeota archaeon]|nr:hypothetical protein [Candidatus Bathyarchaeota archaeon]